MSTDLKSDSGRADQIADPSKWELSMHFAFSGQHYDHKEYFTSHHSTVLMKIFLFSSNYLDPQDKG
jgi:hypothetical protein